MYVIIYDTLMKIFWKISQERKWVIVTCILEKGEGGYVCDIFEIRRLGEENEEMIFLFTLYREQRKGGNYPALNLEGETLPVGLRSHR